MWTDPYLETCCRSALHRLLLAGSAGRPADSKDAGCLHRLAGMGLATHHPNGRWAITQSGRDRHAVEVAASRA
jgi:hypothetical protein